MSVASGIVEENPDSEGRHDPHAWRRCWDRGLSRELSSPQHVHPDAEITRKRHNSGLAHIVEPVWEALTQASSVDQLMIVTDPAGDVLWRYGSRRVRDEAEQIGFVEGADWSEASVGTNAISQAVRTGSAAHMSGEDHFAYSHMAWTCMAAPIHHPVSGETLGVLDISGPLHRLGQEVAPIVRMSARLISAMLRYSPSDHTQSRRLSSFKSELVLPAPREDYAFSGPQPVSSTLYLQLLDEPPAFAIDDGPWQPLSLRIAEILALLSSRERGWTASELTTELHGDFGRAGTVRTDMHRLRQRIGSILASQPYRFSDETTVISDVARIESLVRREDVAGVLERYRQPLLARSENERIQQWRIWLDREIRDLVKRHGTTEQRARWQRTELAWETELLTLHDPASAQKSTG